MPEQFSDVARRAYQGLSVDVGADSAAMYVLTLGFLKILDEARVSGEDTEEETPVRIRDLDIRVPRQCSFRHLRSLHGARDVGRQINVVLEKLEAVNAPKLGNVFRRIDFESEALLRKSSKKRQPLERLIEDLAGWEEPSTRRVPAPASDPGEAFAALLANCPPGGPKPARSGEAQWKHWKFVEETLIDLLGPGAAPRLRILDPACGRGSLLAEAASRCAHRSVQVEGWERDPSAWSLCRMNLVAHGIDPSLVIQGEPSEGGNPPLPYGQFDLVVANFAAWDEQGRRFPPDLGWSLIRQLVDATAEGKGQIGLVLSDLPLALSRGRPGREAIVGQNALACVIELKPENRLQGTPGPSILVLDRSWTEPEREVLFVSMPETDLPRAVELVRERKESEGVSRRVGFDELERNDFRLQAPLYVEAPPADEPSCDGLRRKAEKLKQESEEVEGRISAFLEKRGLL